LLKRLTNRTTLFYELDTPRTEVTGIPDSARQLSFASRTNIDL